MAERRRAELLRSFKRECEALILTILDVANGYIPTGFGFPVV
jgi:hypothetical protein